MQLDTTTIGVVGTSRMTSGEGVPGDDWALIKIDPAVAAEWGVDPADRLTSRTWSSTRQLTPRAPHLAGTRISKRPSGPGVQRLAGQPPTAATTAPCGHGAAATRPG